VGRRGEAQQRRRSAPGAGRRPGGTPGTLVQALDPRRRRRRWPRRARSSTRCASGSTSPGRAALRDDAAFDDALAKAAVDPAPLASFKDEVDSALTFQRGLDGVPQGGFTLVDGRWLTAAERDSARGARRARRRVERVRRAKEASSREATTRLIEAAKGSPAPAAEFLRARAGELGVRLAAAAERAASTPCARTCRLWPTRAARRSPSPPTT